MKTIKSTAITLGIISSLFFALSFILNRQMSLSGGSWIWSSSLRFFFMLPFLLIIVIGQKNFHSLLLVMKENLGKWLLWSTIGFGVFYAPLTFAADYGPSWLVASTWQITIIAGMLIAPLLEKRDNRKKQIISKKALFFSLIILVGVAIMQLDQASNLSVKEMLAGTIPVLIAAFAYPIGNRMMMKVTDGKLDALQRTLGMTIASMPFWIILSIIGLLLVDNPSNNQIQQSLIVAITSGVIATTLFFKATDKAKDDQQLLASVEATQAGEIIFAIMGEIILLNGQFPDVISILGIVLVVIGMILHSVKNK